MTPCIEFLPNVSLSNGNAPNRIMVIMSL